MKFCLINIRKVSIIFSSIILFITPVCTQTKTLYTAQINPIETTKQSKFLTQNGSLVYIDFEEAPFKIEKIQVFTLNYRLVSHEFVGDLPKSTFYEINLENTRPDTYIIHLVGRKEAIKKAIKLR